MKRLYTAISKIKLFSLPCAFFVLLCTFFSSCVREINGVVSLRGEDPGIVFYVDNYSESARTLAPAALTTDGLIFQIDGEDKDGNPYPLTSVTIDSSGKGRIENVSCSIWNLVLHAYLSAADAADKKDVLRGYATADTRNTGSAEIDFVLSSTSIIDEGKTNGDYSITVTYPNATDFATLKEIRCAVYDKATGEVKIQHSPVITGSSDFDLWTSTGYEYTGTLLAGTYVFKIDFYILSEDGNSVLNVGTYSEILDIQPNRTTSVTKELDEVINKKPAAPEDLMVFRVDDDTLNADAYTAVITWKDVATNEDSYIIKLHRISDDGTARVNSITIDNTNSTTFVSASGSIALGWVSGHLNSGSTEFVIRLKTGILYEVEVAAVNALGTSDFVTRTLSAGVDYANLTSLSSTYKNKTLTGFAAPDDSASPDRALHCVNTFSIVYNYNGGRFYNTSTSTWRAYTASSVEYKIYNRGTPVSITIPDNLYYNADNNCPLSEWKLWSDSYSSYVSAGTTYSEHENISLIPVYDNVTSDIHELTLADLSAALTIRDETSSLNYTVGGSSVSVSAGSHIVLTYDASNATVASYDYDQIEFHIIRDDIDKSSIVNINNATQKAVKDFYIDTDTSTYTIKVTARKSNVPANNEPLQVLVINRI